MNPTDTHTAPPLCCTRIPYTNGKKGTRGCIRRGIIREDGHHYCKQHAPAEVIKRDRKRLAGTKRVRLLEDIATLAINHINYADKTTRHTASFRSLKGATEDLQRFNGKQLEAGK